VNISASSGYSSSSSSSSKGAAEPRRYSSPSSVNYGSSLPGDNGTVLSVSVGGDIPSRLDSQSMVGSPISRRDADADSEAGQDYNRGLDGISLPNQSGTSDLSSRKHSLQGTNKYHSSEEDT